MKATFTFLKPPNAPAEEAKPAVKELSANERNVLIARIAALLDENNRLLRELASARAERDALERALNALNRNQNRELGRTG